MAQRCVPCFRMIIKNELEKLLETLFLNAYWLIYELEYNKDPYYNYTDSEVKGLIDFYT